ncbi:hypothetical protein [Zophobihabitans entericus]|uniref:Uncharacterized protein n=1 Tax=Zophobihabitans entericus TaxID=1635327 RepID=A0A6G9I870_9GAMM|nr:hypothetical protein [Zophobihabitans entericus]QIQ20408.1 hypothetical protein IPMB12_01165 [Zophobihabitans entericus]
MTSEKLEGVFYTALQGLPIEKIEIRTRGSKNYPVNITVKEGYEMDEKMKQEILNKLEDYKKSLVFITDEDGALVSAQQVMEDDVESIKDEDKPYYFLSSWRSVYMKVYTVKPSGYYDRSQTTVLCILSVYPKIIEGAEINQYSSSERNIPVFESLDGKPFIVGFDDKYNTVLTRDLGTSKSIFGGFGRLDINGSLHSHCWRKLKNDTEVLYEVIYPAKVLDYFKLEK